MSVNFLLQVTRILHVGEFDDTEIQMIYDYLKNLDNEVLFSYFMGNNILQYDNDLQLCTEIMDNIISILESKEEYEKCQVLLNKKKLAMAITDQKMFKNEPV